MWGRPLEGTVPDGPRTRKDIKMKLLIILATLLAISKAEDVETEREVFDDSLAEASEDLLQPAASSYNYGQASPAPKPWEPNYVPSNQKYYQTQQTQQSWNNQNNYNKPSNNYNTPSNNYNTPSNNYNNPSNNYNIPSNSYNPPSNGYNPPSNGYNPPSNGYNPPSNYPQKPVQSTWQPPTSPSSTTTPIPVIKNEQYFGENGSYKYEYEIADGTHVFEEGYFLNPNTENEILVKKGWYSYTGGDGKVYTITYWADDTGYHATGDHIPKAPPIPPEIQASIDQNAKEEAAKVEAEKNKPQQSGSGGYPQQTGSGGYPQQSGSGGYPQQGGSGGYPQQTGSGGYPQQGGSGGYPQQTGSGSYPQQGGSGGYPQQTGSGGYPQQGGSDGYQPPPKPLKPITAKPVAPKPQYPPQQYPQQQYPQQQYPQQQYPQQQVPQTQRPQQTYYPQQPTQTEQTYYPQENFPSSSGYGK